MKDVFLMVAAILMTLAMIAATAEHNARAAEMASVERIETITNAITDDAVSNALESLNNEELTEVMGL